MKIKLGSVLALVTLIGSIWIGGENLGDARARIRSCEKLIEQQRIELQTLHNHSILDHSLTHEQLVKLQTNMKWLIREVEKN